MKKLWNEIVNSLGFALSAVIVIIVIPIALVNLLGALCKPETWLTILFFAIVVGIPFRRWLKTPTVKQKEYELWVKERRAEPRPRDRRGRLLETSVEEEDRLNIRKREHLRILPSKLCCKYKFGYDGIGSMYVSKASYMIVDTMCKEDCLKFLFKNGWYSKELFDVVERTFCSHDILEFAVDAYIKQHEGIDRDYLEKNEIDLLKRMSWSITYAVLSGTYCHKSLFNLKLSTDAKEYIVGYPFGVPPLKYRFDSTKEEEAAFLQEAWQRVEDCKIIVDKVYREQGYYEVERFLSENNVIGGIHSNYFNWSPGFEKWVAEMEAERKAKQEARAYERKT